MSEKAINSSEYVEQMSILLDLHLHPEHKTGVVENFDRIIKISKVVTEFTLPESIEPAPKFEP